MPFCSRMPWCQFWQEVKDSALWWRERAVSWVHANWRCAFCCSGFNGAWCLFANVQRFVSLSLHALSFACTQLPLVKLWMWSSLGGSPLSGQFPSSFGLSEVMGMDHYLGEQYGLSIPFWSDKLEWVCLPLCTTCLIGLALMKLCGGFFFFGSKVIYLFFLHWRITPLLFCWGWGQTQD